MMLNADMKLLRTCLSVCLIAVVGGADLNSLFPRTICFPQNRPDSSCTTDLIEEHPDLSMSATNLTKADTFFMLFTRDNPDVPENLHKCGGRLPPNTKYDPKKRLIVLTHPFFLGYCDAAAFREWQKQILKREDVNLIGIDYSWGNKIDVGTAEKNLHIVAQQAVIVLKNIQMQKGLDYKNVYIISLSLGAQVAGLIGGMFHVGRITALDPAGPGYDKKTTPLKDRLDRGDADLVDVWHTDMGKCLPDLGLNYDPGHVNFYVNGGKFQPACYKYAIISLLKMDFFYAVSSLLLPQVCSHLFSTEYFKVSVNPGCCQFVGFRCPSKAACKRGLAEPTCGPKGENCMIMGWDLDKYLKNVTDQSLLYYVDTGIDCPYCITDKADLEGFEGTYNSLLQNGTCK